MEKEATLTTTVSLGNLLVAMFTKLLSHYLFSESSIHAKLGQKGTRMSDRSIINRLLHSHCRRPGCALGPLMEIVRKIDCVLIHWFDWFDSNLNGTEMMLSEWCHCCCHCCWVAGFCLWWQTSVLFLWDQTPGEGKKTFVHFKCLLILILNLTNLMFSCLVFGLV